jgi:hypothetical protein
MKKELEGMVSRKSYDDLMSKFSQLEALVQKLEKDSVQKSQTTESDK